MDENCSTIGKSPESAEPISIRYKCPAALVTFLHTAFSLCAMAWSTVLFIWYPRRYGDKPYVIVIDSKIVTSILSSTVGITETTLMFLFGLAALDFFLHRHLLNGMATDNVIVVGRMWKLVRIITFFGCLAPLFVSFDRGVKIIDLLGYVYVTKLGLYLFSTIFVSMYFKQLDKPVASDNIEKVCNTYF